jgi:hypothetical protein
MLGLEVSKMGKPSIFSHDYKERLKKRRINTFLFVLLIICIAFFGGKYYLSRHEVTAINNFKNSKILRKLTDLNLWSKIKGEFSKFDKPVVKQKPPKAVVVPVLPPTKTVTTQGGVTALKVTYEYSYLTKAGKKIIIKYERQASKVTFIGLNAEDNNSDYDISKEKNAIVFDIKNESSIISCDSKGKFTVLSRGFYTTSKTHKKIMKETVMASYKNYIWAAKPHFTLDGRVTYISRLPYIRNNNTLYLWTVKLDGTNHKKIYMLNEDINKISYAGFDNTNRLIVKVDNTKFYLDNGSYTLVK